MGAFIEESGISAPLFVEIGVDKADTSVRLLDAFPLLRLVGIDPYVGMYGGVLSSQRRDGMGSSNRYDVAYNRLQLHGSRALLLRLHSLRAAEKWNMGLIDIVFIDGEHDLHSCTHD